MSPRSASPPPPGPRGCGRPPPQGQGRRRGRGWLKMPVNGRWDAALLASRTPIPLPRSTRMEENPKSIARPSICPCPTRYKKRPERSWSKSRCLDANDVLVDDDRNEVACRQLSSRGFSRRSIKPPKPPGSANRKTPKRLAENDEPRWRVASAKSTQGNRSIVASCEAIKRPERESDPITWHHGPTRTTKSQLSTPTPTLPTRGDFTLSHSSRPLSRQGRGGRH